MDDNANLSEVEYRSSQHDRAHNIGLVRVLPINVDTCPEQLFLDLWGQIKEQGYAFEDHTRNDMAAFAKSMIQPNTFNFEVPGVAFGQLVGCFEGSNCEIHFCTLKTGPTEPLLQAGMEMFWFAFEQVKVNRITALIPGFNGKIIRFATLMRMKYEGQIRKAFLYNKEYWDLHLYGILASEWRTRGRLQ